MTKETLLTKIRVQGLWSLKNVTVEFPLGVLCVVAGVSGSGKSSLVEKTLYGALCARKRKAGPKPLPYDDVFGDGQFDDVVLIDQSPLGGSSRSNAATLVKAFDEIRNVFAENCRLDSPNLDHAIRFKNNALRGGIVEHVRYRNLDVGQVRRAVVTVDFNYEEGANGRFTPVLRDAVIENVLHTLDRALVRSSVLALPGRSLEMIAPEHAMRIFLGRAMDHPEQDTVTLIEPFEAQRAMVPVVDRERRREQAEELEVIQPRK